MKSAALPAIGSPRGDAAPPQACCTVKQDDNTARGLG